MTPFRRWIESKCKYSTQWGACNVSSSARSASDLGVLLNLSPVSVLRCVPVVVVSFESFVFIPPPPFFREPGEETRSRTLVAVWCRHRARSPPLPFPSSFAAPPQQQQQQHMHQPAALPVAVPALSSCEIPSLIMQLPSSMCVCFIMFTCMFSFRDVSVSCSSFPLTHNTQG